MANAAVPQPAVQPPLGFQVPAGENGLTIGPFDEGQRLRFEASGSWCDGFMRCGPEGYRSFFFHALDIWPRYWNAPYFCLIGMVEGEPETMFRIGGGTEFKMPHKARLVVFANDHRWGYWNNSKDDRIDLLVERLPADAPEPPQPAARPHPTGWALARLLLDRTQGALLIPSLALLVGVALALLPQGRDLVRAVTEDPIGGQQIAFAATLLFLCLQSWFWPRVIINYQFGSERAAWPARPILEWTPRVLPFLPFIPVLYAVLGASSRSWDIALLLTLTAAVLFLIILRYHDARNDKTVAAPPNRPPPKVGGMWVRLGLVIALASFAVVTLAPVGPARLLGPPAVVFLGVGLIIPPLAMIIQAGASIRFPGLAVVIGAALVFGLWMDNHEVGRRAAVAEVRAPYRQISLAQAYQDWKDRTPPLPDGSRPMVLVAAEGGASRAGFWTGEVLAALHADSKGALADRLFAISSVSGGSVGAVGYVAALKEHRNNAVDLERRLSAFTGADALSPALAGLLFTDLAQRFIPLELPWLPDRAETLERSWEVAWRDGCLRQAGCRPELLASPFLGLWAANDTAWTPLVIVNGASEETGRRILTSKVALARGEVSADDFHTTVGHDVAASTAIHNGARFPYVSPAGTLRNEGGARGHIIDGGYFDPAGTEVLREIAHAIKQGPGAKDVADGKLTFIFVYIGYSGTTDVAQGSGPASEPSAAQANTNVLGNELLAPALGMLASRSGHAALLMTSLKADVARDGLEHRPFLTAFGPNTGAALPGSYVPILLCDTKSFTAPMDWALSRYAQDQMRAAVRGCPSNPERLAAVVRLMGANAAPR